MEGMAAQHLRLKPAGFNSVHHMTKMMQIQPGSRNRQLLFGNLRLRNLRGTLIQADADDRSAKGRQFDRLRQRGCASYGIDHHVHAVTAILCPAPCKGIGFSGVDGMIRAHHSGTLQSAVQQVGNSHLCSAPSCLLHGTDADRTGTQHHDPVASPCTTPKIGLYADAVRLGQSQNGGVNPRLAEYIDILFRNYHIFGKAAVPVYAHDCQMKADI